MASRSIATVNGSLTFDAAPITAFAGIRLLARSVEFTGRVTGTSWRAAIEFAAAALESSPYWLGDLLAYADTRAEWREMADQVASSLGLALQTIKNKHYISTHVGPKTRAIAPSFSHAAEVASMPPAEQMEWMEQAVDRGLQVSALRREIRAAKRRGIIEGQATLEGQYRVVYARPPWDTMSVEDLCRLPVAAHTAPDAVLFMWVSASVLLANPGPRDVLEAWGFTYRTGVVWDKVHGSAGSYTYVRHEHLVIATRGACLPDYATASIDTPEGLMQSVHTERRANITDDAKPVTYRRAIERMYTVGPYLELFARERSEGWVAFGSEAKSWHIDARK